MKSRKTSTSQYRRGGPIREPYDVVLIACEGQKTEPNYLRSLQVAYGLSSVNLRILPPPRSDPMCIVEFVIEHLKDEEINRGYCVFDRDRHANFDAAMRRIRLSPLGRSGRLIAVPSTPCFEIWVLLHYRYSTGAFTEASGESACQRVIRELQQYFTDYAKGHREVYATLQPRMQQAIDNAMRLERHNTDTKNLNPATHMHYLVRYLTKLK